MSTMEASAANKLKGSKKKGPLVAAMLKKHETPEHEQDLHLAPGVRQGKRDLEEALETQPDRRGLEARGILKSESEGFSAAAQLQKVRSTGAAVGISAPAAEEETVPVIRQDTVASRVQDLYDKIRADPDSATGRDLAVRVENNSLSNVELDGNCVSSGGAKQEEIETRLKSLDERFTKAQSLEAEKYKVLRMLVMRIQEDCGGEKCSLDVIKERYDREVRSIEGGILLDLNVHRQARRDLDKGIATQIDEKFGIFSAELAEERQERMEAGTRVSLDPQLITTLTSNIEQEGTLRYDRGEELLEKIRAKTVNLHNMLSCEEDAHAHIEEFTEQVSGRCADLKEQIEKENQMRALIETKHRQRMDQLRELKADVHVEQQKRDRKREGIHLKIKEEIADFFKYAQSEQGDRQQSEEYILRMCDKSSTKLEEEIKTERDARESSEEHFFKLLEETCQRARNRLS